MNRKAFGKYWAAGLLSLMALTATVQAQAPWSGPLMQRGIAALTCGGPAEDNTGAALPAASVYTFGLTDLRSPSGADYGGCGIAAPLWNPPMYHHSSWNAENLGNVFGITLDAGGNMYVAAHGLFGTYRPLHHRYGNLGGGPTSLAAAGTVYRISAATGAATVFAVIPGQQTMFINSTFSSGPGLGNIAYDRTHDQFFVSSLEDGKIYRLDASGTVLNSFDPFLADNGAVGMPPRSERVWAVEVLDDGVFYSIWNNGDSSSPGVIRRVGLTGTGDFNVVSDGPVLTVPPQGYVLGGGTPVSDITFSLDGQTMILGTRTMSTDTTAYNHVSATHMAALSGLTWTVTRTQNTGCNNPQGEAYGGVAFGEEAGGQDAIVWASSADMAVNYGPHGVFGVRTPDFPVSGQATNSFKVPYDATFANHYRDDRKGSGGDIEIMRETVCAKIRVRRIDCPKEAGGGFTVTLDITNLGSSTAHYVWFTPCPTGSLPAGAVTTQPQPSGIITLPTPLAPNSSASVTVTLPGNVGGEQVCFRVTLLDREGEECCTEKICFDVPPCDCAEIIDQTVECEVQADGTIKYTITLTIRNLTHLTSNPYAFSYVSALPPTGFSPSFATPTPNPIPPGGVGTVELCYYGTPGPLCFTIGLHDDSLVECCSPSPICVTLPECPPGGHEPDTCALEEKVPCDPATGTATVNYTICNNSPVARTYTWSASGITNPSCNQMLTSADFSPSSGTLGPIPPGGCMTVPITIRCEGFEPGDCAGYQICASFSDNAEPLCCRGVVYESEPGAPIIMHAKEPGSVIAIAPRSSASLRFQLRNPTDETMNANVFVRDAVGLLAFAGEAGADSSVLFSTPLVLDPSSVQDLVIQARRLDDGKGAPDFTSLEVWATTEGTPRVGAQNLIIPVRLVMEVIQERLEVKGFKLEEGVSPRIAITVGTVAGKRYRVEQSPKVTDSWSSPECSTSDTTVDAGGYLKGTGGDVTCFVECDPATEAMFFRIVEYP